MPKSHHGFQGSGETSNSTTMLIDLGIVNYSKQEFLDHLIHLCSLFQGNELCSTVISLSSGAGVFTSCGQRAMQPFMMNLNSKTEYSFCLFTIEETNAYLSNRNIPLSSGEAAASMTNLNPYFYLPYRPILIQHSYIQIQTVMHLK